MTKYLRNFSLNINSIEYVLSKNGNQEKELLGFA